MTHADVELPGGQSLTEARDEADGTFIEKPHSLMRKTIARRLAQSKATVPHFYARITCRCDALLAQRAAANAAGQRISVNDLLIKAIGAALSTNPAANVQFDEKVMRHYRSVDVSVAVATPRGLVTPIVRDVPEKSVQDIAAEVRELAIRAKEGKLNPHEYNGGTTCISNLGMFGLEEFSAILNPPQASIFAIGLAEPRVVADGNEVRIANVMTITASFDHRAIDGAVAARVMGSLKTLIEHPNR